MWRWAAIPEMGQKQSTDICRRWRELTRIDHQKAIWMLLKMCRQKLKPSLCLWKGQLTMGLKAQDIVLRAKSVGAEGLPVTHRK